MQEVKPPEIQKPKNVPHFYWGTFLVMPPPPPPRYHRYGRILKKHSASFAQFLAGLLVEAQLFPLKFRARFIHETEFRGISQTTADLAEKHE